MQWSTRGCFTLTLQCSDPV